MQAGGRREGRGSERRIQGRVRRAKKNVFKKRLTKILKARRLGVHIY